MKSTLALHGGNPIATHAIWPTWPAWDSQTEYQLLTALRSGRWAISGPVSTRRSFNREFAERFAEYLGCRYCFPVASGTAALSVALEAVGVQRGDQVIIPAVTWVACASSVLSIGAQPVPVDVSPSNLAVEPELISVQIGPKTKAILVVHPYCSLADVDALLRISTQHGIPIVEDCSQAHGAMWRDRKVGTFGTVAVFSMQQTKLLCSGEGGAVVTDNKDLYVLMQQLSCDGRQWSTSEPKPWELELIPKGDVQGRNRGLSEFHASILLDRLPHLDAEINKRLQGALALLDRIRQSGLGEPLRLHRQVTKQSIFNLVIRLKRSRFSNAVAPVIAQALSAELEFLVLPLDPPLPINMLYVPSKCPWIGQQECDRGGYDIGKDTFPHAVQAYDECIRIPHHILTADAVRLELIVQALVRVSENSQDL